MSTGWVSGRDLQGLLNHPANAGLTSSAPDLKPACHVLSARLSLLVSSKPSGVSTCSILTGSFHRAYLCIRVRIGTPWGLTTSYLFTRGVITTLVWLRLIAQSVSGAITEQSHSYHLATPKLHWTAQLSPVTIRSLYSFAYLHNTFFSERLYVEILYEMSDCWSDCM